MSGQTENSYGRMLRSSALLGGSSAINVGLSILRNKVLAVQLGPALFGVMGLYSSLGTLIQGVAGMGLGQSAVRDIAAAAASEDQAALARTVSAYRRMVWITGSIGLLATLALAYPASLLTFGDGSHAWPLAGMSLAVLLTQVQAGQMALLQGLRRIGDLSRISVFGAIWSTALAIPILLLLRERGIVPFLVAGAVGQLAASWWYARKVKLEPVSLSWREIWRIGRPMLRLGASFLVTGLAATGSLYVIRLLVKLAEGTAAVGLYQAAYTISGVYVGFVLTAMGGDYYPRLAGLSGDREGRNRLVNEQVKLALLLATPALAAGLSFSTPLIHLIYSSKFAPATEILRWQVLGLFGRILSWPLGFLLMARGDARAYLLCEVAATAVHILLVWLGLHFLGVWGVGAAFVGLYVFYSVLVYVVGRRRHEFTAFASTWRLVFASLAVVLLAFGTTYLDSPILPVILGGLLTLVSGVASLEALASLVPESRPARLWRSVLRAAPPLDHMVRLMRRLAARVSRGAQDSPSS